MELLDTVRGLTGIDTYSAADSVVILGNRILEEYTKVQIMESDSNRDEKGIDQAYYKAVQLPIDYTISIHLLPDSQDGDFIRKLNDYIRENGGFFEILISNNGKFVGKWNAFIKKNADVDIDVEPENEVFTFGGLKQTQLKMVNFGNTNNATQVNIIDRGLG